MISDAEKENARRRRKGKKSCQPLWTKIHCCGVGCAYAHKFTDHPSLGMFIHGQSFVWRIAIKKWNIFSLHLLFFVRKFMQDFHNYSICINKNRNRIFILLIKISEAEAWNIMKLFEFSEQQPSCCLLLVSYLLWGIFSRYIRVIY